MNFQGMVVKRCYCHSLMHMEINFKHELPMIWQIINYGKFSVYMRKHIISHVANDLGRIYISFLFCAMMMIFHVWWFLIFLHDSSYSNSNNYLKRFQSAFMYTFLLLLFFYQNQFSWIVMHGDKYCRRHGNKIMNEHYAAVEFSFDNFSCNTFMYTYKKRR